MKTSLLDFKFKEIVSSNGTSYIDYRKSLNPHFYKVWIGIALSYSILFFVLYLNNLMQEFFSSKILILFFSFLSALVIGFTIAHITLYLHEASHFGLARNYALNDFLGTAIIGVLLGTTTDKYRQVHWQHHVHLGTTKDPENSYFSPLNFSTILNTLFFVTAFKKLFFKNTVYVKIKKSVFNKIILIIGMCIHFSLLIFFYKHQQWINFFSWSLGMYCFFPFFGWLRQLLEHRALDASSDKNYFEVNQNAVSRMFRGGILTKIFGGAGFDKHLLHHWDHTISCTRFKDLENFLLTTNVHIYVQKEYTTYSKTFFNLLRQK